MFLVKLLFDGLKDLLIFTRLPFHFGLVLRGRLVILLEQLLRWIVKCVRRGYLDAEQFLWSFKFQIYAPKNVHIIVNHGAPKIAQARESFLSSELNFLPIQKLHIEEVAIASKISRKFLVWLLQNVDLFYCASTKDHNSIWTPQKVHRVLIASLGPFALRRHHRPLVIVCSNGQTVHVRVLDWTIPNFAPYAAKEVNAFILDRIFNSFPLGLGFLSQPKLFPLAVGYQTSRSLGNKARSICFIVHF